MKINQTVSRVLHVMLAIALVLPGLIWMQGTARASGTTWRDITSNADANPRSLAQANGKLYLLYSTGKKILQRGPSDSNWSKLADLPANQFTAPIELEFHGNDMYIIDQGDVNAHPLIPSKLMKSSDNGQTWTAVTEPAGGFNTINGTSLHTLFFDNNDNLYVADYMNIYKLDTNGNWSKIDPYPEDSNYTYRFANASTDGTGKLYSVITKIYKMMPTSGQTAAIYSYDGTSWTLVNAPLPGSNMILSHDASGNLYVRQGPYNFFLTPHKNIYSFNGAAIDLEAYTDTFWWTSAGMVFDGSYYYIADTNTDGKIQTTNPTFGDVKPSPTLTADTTDNDTAHALELTFTDDADWRAAVTDVSIKRNGTVTSSVYAMQAGVLTLTGITVPGDYYVQIKASGYADATVNQHVDLTPSVWYDITSDLGLQAPILTVNDAVYAMQAAGTGFSYRFPADIGWSTQEWPQGRFVFPYSFITRGSNWYVTDFNGVRRINISNDRGATWTSYDMPQNLSTTGILTASTVSPTGAIYLFDGKNVTKLSENHNWSQIPVFPDDNGYKFNYTGIAVDSSGQLFANIGKSNPLLPLNNSAKLYKYDEINEQWVFVADSPNAMMQLYSDADGGMHAAPMMAAFGETPPLFAYKIDETGFTQTATLDNLEQVRYGLAYEDGYYYTVDANFTTIRTTNPNFSTGLDAPALTADTSDNDDLHPLALTFTDDVAWRSQITAVTIKKDGSVISANYQMTPGALQILQPLPAGTYTIEITSTGYKKVSVQQTVLITSPALIADRSQNDTKHNLDMTFTDNTAWRAAVTAVEYNGTVADSSMYELTAGKLTFFAGKLPVGTHQIVVKATGYPDATVTQAVIRPSTSSPAATSNNQEIIKIDVRGGSKSGNLVSQAEIIRTTDDKGKKNDQVSLTSELAAKAVAAMGSTGSGQAVIVVPDDKDEVASTQVALPHDALQKLSDAGIGLTIETRGAKIEIPVTSLMAASDDLIFHLVPLKESSEQQEVAERAKANSNSSLKPATVIGRPMAIETNLQSHPVTLTLPLGTYPAERIAGLHIYIEHSDGTKEWLQGEAATDDNGASAIRFTVSKFSTFTVIESEDAAVQQQAYIVGYEDGSFRPEQAVTRGQLAAMLSRLYGSTAVDTSGVPAYTDQTSFPAWASDAIRQVTALGLMDGYEDGAFKPERAVTRAEAATIAVRAAKLNAATQQATGFSDTAGHWAAAQIDVAAAAGLVDGYSDGRFQPDRTLNRAEAVTLLNRVTGRAALNDQLPRWSDVPTAHWAFGAIQAASLNGEQ
ncbi:S-layer homology domain-containing protein [Paenibacillus athensensis]|nr:S-layer homology domain-containing protein [Paenibacillus athensensis]MCD1259435.1 S-layer homology domain-containing protein [Paenibacillus athensensis]